MRLKYFLMLALVALACQPHATQKSELDHDAGRFLNSISPNQWYAIDDATWLQVEAMGSPSFSAQHPMSQRLQAWSDRIRENMLKTTPQLKIAPRPIIRIIDSNEVNAYVSAVNMCVDVAITTDPNSKALPDEYSYLHTTGSLYRSNRPTDCKVLEGDLETKRKFVQWALRNQPNCKVTSFAAQLAVTPSCIEGASMGIETFTGLATYVTHNYITFFRALIEHMSEDEVVGVLAHELGHYYMSHITADPALYNYFYEMTARNANTKPQPLPAGHPLAGLGAQIRAQPELQFVEMEGQEFHSLMFNPMQSLVYSISWDNSGFACRADQPDCKTICQPFVDNLATRYDRLLEWFPYYIDSSDQAKAAYARYEAEAKTCLAAINATYIEMILRSSVQSALQYSVPDMTPPATADETALSYSQRVNSYLTAAVDQMRAELQRLVREGTQRGLGWYTAEQEADDISTEMVFRLGLDPMAVVTAELVFDDLHGGSGECREEYAKGFPTAISIGNYSEPHHDSCFRAYNSYRELEVHQDYFAGFKENARPVIQPELSWQAVVALLKQVY